MGIIWLVEVEYYRAMSDSLAKAAELAYDLMASIELEGSHFRSDIGRKAL